MRQPHAPCMAANTAIGLLEAVFWLRTLAAIAGARGFTMKIIALQRKREELRGPCVRISGGREFKTSQELSE